jgi:hypothetical protein
VVARRFKSTANTSASSSSSSAAAAAATAAAAASREGRLAKIYRKLDWGTVIMNVGAISGLCGFMMSDVLYLRMLSIGGSLCGITYNITRSPRQINACLWGAVFVSTNLFMIVQLLKERSAEAPLFSLAELELWQRHFSDHGVDHKTFKRLMDQARWETKRVGEVIVPAGKPLERVILIHDGVATAFKEGLDKHGLRWSEKMYEYEGRGRNGCVIGGTALVDPNTTRHAYPQTVRASGGARKWAPDQKKVGESPPSLSLVGAGIQGVPLHVGRGSGANAAKPDAAAAAAIAAAQTAAGDKEQDRVQEDKSHAKNIQRARRMARTASGRRKLNVTDKTVVVSWDREELQELLRNDTALEAAFVHTLYIDLLTGLRRQRKQGPKQGQKRGGGGDDDLQRTADARGKTMVHASRHGGDQEGTAVSAKQENMYLNKGTISRENKPGVESRVQNRQRIRERLMRYKDMLVACMDEKGVQLNPRKKREARIFALSEGISVSQHVTTIASLGWTKDEWNDGIRFHNIVVENAAES